MADKLTRDMGDGSPRDASKMGSNSHTGLYAVLVLVALGVLGLMIYSGTPSDTSPTNPPATTNQP